MLVDQAQLVAWTGLLPAGYSETYKNFASSGFSWSLPVLPIFQGDVSSSPSPGVETFLAGLGLTVGGFLPSVLVSIVAFMAAATVTYAVASWFSSRWAPKEPAVVSNLPTPPPMVAVTPKKPTAAAALGKSSDLNSLGLGANASTDSISPSATSTSAVSSHGSHGLPATAGGDDGLSTSDFPGTPQNTNTSTHNTQSTPAPPAVTPQRAAVASPEVAGHVSKSPTTFSAWMGALFTRTVLLTSPIVIAASVYTLAAGLGFWASALAVSALAALTGAVLVLGSIMGRKQRAGTLHREAKTLARYGGLYQSYSKSAWWFVCILFSRQVIVGLAVGLSAVMPIGSVVLVLLAYLAYALAVLAISPHALRAMGAVEVGRSFVAAVHVAVMSSWVGAPPSAMAEALSVVLMVVQSGVLLVLAGLTMYHFAHYTLPLMKSQKAARASLTSPLRPSGVARHHLNHSLSLPTPPRHNISSISLSAAPALPPQALGASNISMSTATSSAPLLVSTTTTSSATPVKLPPPATPSAVAEAATMVATSIPHPPPAARKDSVSSRSSGGDDESDSMGDNPAAQTGSSFFSSSQHADFLAAAPPATVVAAPVLTLGPSFPVYSTPPPSATAVHAANAAAAAASAVASAMAALSPSGDAEVPEPEMSHEESQPTTTSTPSLASTTESAKTSASSSGSSRGLSLDLPTPAPAPSTTRRPALNLVVNATPPSSADPSPAGGPTGLTLNTIPSPVVTASIGAANGNGDAELMAKPITDAAPAGPASMGPPPPVVLSQPPLGGRKAKKFSPPGGLALQVGTPIGASASPSVDAVPLPPPPAGGRRRGPGGLSLASPPIGFGSSGAAIPMARMIPGVYGGHGMEPPPSARGRGPASLAIPPTPTAGMSWVPPTPSVRRGGEPQQRFTFDFPDPPSPQSAKSSTSDSSTSTNISSPGRVEPPRVPRGADKPMVSFDDYMGSPDKSAPIMMSPAQPIPAPALVSAGSMNSIGSSGMLSRSSSRTAVPLGASPAGPSTPASGGGVSNSGPPTIEIGSPAPLTMRLPSITEGSEIAVPRPASAEPPASSPMVALSLPRPGSAQPARPISNLAAGPVGLPRGGEGGGGLLARRRKFSLQAPPTPSVPVGGTATPVSVGTPSLDIASPAGTPGAGLSLNLGDLGSTGFRQDPEAVRRELLRRFEPKISKVFPYLYLGSNLVASNKDLLLAHGITHVINAAVTICPNHHPESFKYLSFPLRDSHNEDMEKVLYDAIEFIEDARMEGGRVYVHCQQGVSRSSSIVMAYVMVTRQRDVSWARAYVRKQRKIADPNYGFTSSLVKWNLRVSEAIARSSGSPNSGRGPLPVRLWAVISNNMSRSAAGSGLGHRRAISLSSALFSDNGAAADAEKSPAEKTPVPSPAPAAPSSSGKRRMQLSVSTASLTAAGPGGELARPVFAPPTARSSQSTRSGKSNKSGRSGRSGRLGADDKGGTAPSLGAFERPLTPAQRGDETAVPELFGKPVEVWNPKVLDLSEDGVLVLVSPSTTWVWSGRHAPESWTEYATNVLAPRLVRWEGAPAEIEQVCQGSEPALFMGALAVGPPELPSAFADTISALQREDDAGVDDRADVPDFDYGLTVEEEKTGGRPSGVWRKGEGSRPNSGSSRSSLASSRASARASARSQIVSTPASAVSAGPGERSPKQCTEEGLAEVPSLFRLPMAECYGHFDSDDLHEDGLYVLVSGSDDSVEAGTPLAATNTPPEGGFVVWVWVGGEWKEPADGDGDVEGYLTKGPVADLRAALREGLNDTVGAALDAAPVRVVRSGCEPETFWDWFLDG